MKSALIIAEPWISKILSGEKIWEIRTRNTKKRGEIGLIRKGSGLIIGSAELVSVLALPRDIDILNSTFSKHRCDSGNLISYGDSQKSLYAWVLKNALAFEEPVSYTHPRGAVVWVKVPDCKNQNC